MKPCSLMNGYKYTVAKVELIKVQKLQQIKVATILTCVLFKISFNHCVNERKFLINGDRGWEKYSTKVNYISAINIIKLLSLIYCTHYNEIA